MSDAKESAIGNEVVTGRLTPNATYRGYMVERPGHTKKVRGAEAVLEIDIKYPYPVHKVWPAFADQNAWMKRYGYFWTSNPAFSQDRFIYLGNAGTANESKYGGDAGRIPFVIRKVIPEQLIYLESLPMPMMGRDGVWSGHNIESLTESDGETTINVFMEHTWFSETLPMEELRKEASFMLGPCPTFWKDYFIPDLTAMIESGTSGPTVGRSGTGSRGK